MNALTDFDNSYTWFGIGYHDSTISNSTVYTTWAVEVERLGYRSKPGTRPSCIPPQPKSPATLGVALQGHIRVTRNHTQPPSFRVPRKWRSRWISARK